jgi:inosine-uridine nucleoside N-ribohydrolase
MGIPVVLDCDTGTDDAVAIMLAARHPDLDLLGVTTVWGNHDVRHTTDNTLRVLDHVGRADVPVHAGADAPYRPRLGPLPSGRADLPPELDLPPARRHPEAQPAVRWLLRTLHRSARPVTLVATGPLTNLAAALEADPAVVDVVDRLVVLGGAHRHPGVTPYAERNVWSDPEAAAAVLAAGFQRATLVTMDATFSAPLTRADADRIAASDTPAAHAAASFVRERIRWYRRDATMAAAGAAPLHDPLAVACLVDPAVVGTLPASVAVETRDPATYGATSLVLDPPRPTLEVALTADHARYLDLLCATL